MPGSPGGLLRIDRVFHSTGYTNAFGGAPLVFGAFPSLHSGCAVMEALFLSHFFPTLKPVYWGYVGVLWWSTMYLSHHYLIDLAGGACLSVMVFYVTMPPAFKDVDQIDWAAAAAYESVPMGEDLTADEEFEREMRALEDEVELTEAVEAAEAGQAGEAGEVGGSDAADKKNKRSVSWGETKVLGEGEQGR